MKDTMAPENGSTATGMQVLEQELKGLREELREKTTQLHLALTQKEERAHLQSLLGENLKDILKGMQEPLSREREQTKSLQNNLTQCQAEREALREKASALEAEKASMHATLEQLTCLRKQETQSHKDDMASFKASTEAAFAAIHAAHDQAQANLRATCDTSRADLERVTSRFDQQQDLLRHRQDIIDQQADQLATLHKTHAHTVSELTRLRQAYEARQDDLRHETAQHTSLQRQLQMTKGETRQVLARLSTCQASLVATQKQCERLVMERDEMRAALRDARASLEAHRRTKACGRMSVGTQTSSSRLAADCVAYTQTQGPLTTEKVIQTAAVHRVNVSTMAQPSKPIVSSPVMTRKQPAPLSINHRMNRMPIKAATPTKLLEKADQTTRGNPTTMLYDHGNEENESNLSIDSSFLFHVAQEKRALDQQIRDRITSFAQNT